MMQVRPVTHTGTHDKSIVLHQCTVRHMQYVWTAAVFSELLET